MTSYDSILVFDADLEGINNPEKVNLIEEKSEDGVRAGINSRIAKCCATSRTTAAAFCMECCDIDPAEDSEEECTKMMKITGCEVAVAITYCYWFQYLIHDEWCNFMFKCGCGFVYTKSWWGCNYWDLDSDVRCPWCVARANVSWTTDNLIFALMAVSFLTCLYYRRRIKYYPTAVRWIAPAAMYFVSGTFVGLIFKLASSYPHFLFYRR